MARGKRTCTPLCNNHRLFIAEEIYRLLPTAGNERDPMACAARSLIDYLIWFWTADGVDAVGNAVRDGIKYDLRHQRHTIQALNQWEKNGERGSGLRHEHAVPKKLLLEHLLTLSTTSVSSVHEILTRFCFAVIVTKEEDELLSKKGFRSRMPSGWNFSTQDCDPLARYAAIGLAVRPPRSAQR